MNAYQEIETCKLIDDAYHTFYKNRNEVAPVVSKDQEWNLYDIEHIYDMLHIDNTNFPIDIYGRRVYYE